NWTWDRSLRPAAQRGSPHLLFPVTGSRDRIGADISTNLRSGRIEWGLRRWKRPPHRTVLLPRGPAIGDLHAARPWSAPGRAVCGWHGQGCKQRELPQWWSMFSFCVETRLAASPRAGSLLAPGEDGASPVSTGVRRLRALPGT